MTLYQRLSPHHSGEQKPSARWARAVEANLVVAVNTIDLAKEVCLVYNYRHALRSVKLKFKLNNIWFHRIGEN